jgi:hypothetical protein
VLRPCFTPNITLAVLVVSRRSFPSFMFPSCLVYVASKATKVQFITNAHHHCDDIRQRVHPKKCARCVWFLRPEASKRYCHFRWRGHHLSFEVSHTLWHIAILRFGPKFPVMLTGSRNSTKKLISIELPLQG